MTHFVHGTILNELQSNFPRLSSNI